MHQFIAVAGTAGPTHGFSSRLARRAEAQREATLSTRLLVTARGLNATRRTRRVVERALPASRVRASGFGGIVLVDADGDAVELAEAVARRCAGRIGRVVAVMDEVESREPTTRDAAVRAGIENIGPEETFCFRIHKRGAHGFVEDTRELESEIGSAIWQALERRHGRPPHVDLEDPDVTVTAEALGPWTAVGISKKSWSTHARGIEATAGSESHSTASSVDPDRVVGVQLD